MKCVYCIIILFLLIPATGFSQPITGAASWYSTESCRVWEKRGVANCPTASGVSLYDLEKKGIDFAASWDFAFGTRLNVCETKTQTCTDVIVVDRGPARKLNRIIDLSLSAFQKIEDPNIGVVEVTVEVVT